MTRRRSIRCLAVALFLCAAVSSCYQGQWFDYENVGLLVEGVTTQEDVLDYFGAPYRVGRVRTTEGLLLTWDYQYVPNRGEGAELRVFFDEAGIVRSYDYTLIHVN